MRRAFYLLTAALFCLLSGSILANAAQAPRFSFREGEDFAYKIHLKLHANAMTAFEEREELRGVAIFKVLSVDEKGAAKIELTTRGRGEIVSRGRTVQLKDEKSYKVLMWVEPDGRISALCDHEGKKTTFLTSFEAFQAGQKVQAFVAATYTLFGLRLPDKLPKVKGEWQHDQLKECDIFAKQDPDWVRLEPVPVEYRYLGKRKVDGQVCCLFSHKVVFQVNKPRADCRIFFDTEKGRIQRLVMKHSSPSFSVDITAELAKVEDACCSYGRSKNMPGQQP